MQLQPYLFFGGTCAAAIDFYKSVFGGSAEVMRFGDNPGAAAHMPREVHDNVMHASFTAPGVAFMASDGMPDKKYPAGNICMALATTDIAAGEKMFAALAEGGTITKPMEKMFWGAYFGEVTDRFGIEWMMNAG